MGWLEGMLGGFSGRKYDVEAQNIREAELTADRESRVFQALLGSSDPEVQAMATAGMLESAGPRKKKGGIRGWLGEMQTSPTFASLQELIKTPVQTSPGEAPTLPSRQIQQVVPGQAPTLEGSMGTPAHSLTEPGAPPPAKIAYQEMPGNVGKPPTFGPRRLFPTTEETAAQTARGKAQGDVEGEVAGLVTALGGGPEAEQRARALIAEKYERQARGGAGGYQSIAGELPNGQSAFGVFNRQTGAYHDPNTGEPLQGFRPRTTTGSVSLGSDLEAIAREMFGVPAARLTRSQMATARASQLDRAQQTSFRRGVGTGEAKIRTELASPIGGTMAKEFNVSPTTTLGELQNRVGLTDQQKDRAYAIGQVDTLIANIDELIPKVFPNVQPGIRGAIQSAFSLGIQRLSRDEDLAALDASINSSLAQMAQLAGQPGSRLSDRDIELARSALANLTPTIFGGDTLATARARMGVVHQLLDKARESIPMSPQIGQPPPGASVSPSAKGPGGTGPVGYTVDKDGNLFLNGQPVQ